MEIKFLNEKTSSRGRNKDIKTVGIHIETNPDNHVIMKPLTTKGTISNNAYLAVPKSDLKEFIKELQKLV